LKEGESRTNEPSHNDDSILNDDHGTTTRIEKQNNESTIHQNVSLAHKSLESDSCVLFLLDLETGGPKYGIIQLLVVAFSKSGKILGEFDQFIKPPPKAIWSEQAMQVHNLRPSLNCDVVPRLSRTTFDKVRTKLGSEPSRASTSSKSTKRTKT
jgi:hypothetical protein